MYTGGENSTIIEHYYEVMYGVINDVTFALGASERSKSRLCYVKAIELDTGYHIRFKFLCEI